MKTINTGLKTVYRDGNNPHLPTMISIITPKQCARICIDDIEMLEQVGRVLHLITANKDYAIYENINKISPALSGRCFYRPLHSLIINFDRVRDMEDLYIYFQSGQCTTMGRNAFGKTRAQYRKYLEESPEYMYEEDSLKVAEK